MAKISAREAVKQFSVTKPTLVKALKEGKISGQKNEVGNWVIDTSELLRVYHPRGSEGVKPTRAKNTVITEDIPRGESVLPSRVKSLPDEVHAEVEALRVKLAEAEERAKAEKERAEAEKLRADAAAKEAEFQTRSAALLERHLDDLRRLLPAPSEPQTPSVEPPAPPAKRGRWWPFGH